MCHINCVFTTVFVGEIDDIKSMLCEVVNGGRGRHDVGNYRRRKWEVQCHRRRGEDICLHIEFVSEGVVKMNELQ